MCEQAAEAHKSKGVGNLSRRGRASLDSGQISKSSVDALLSNSISASSSQVIIIYVRCYDPVYNFSCLNV